MKAEAESEIVYSEITCTYICIVYVNEGFGTVTSVTVKALPRDITKHHIYVTLGVLQGQNVAHLNL